MGIVKKCRSCKEYFPAELKSFVCYCPKCYPLKKHHLLNRFKQDRYISVDNFDVFDDHYPVNKYWHQKFERVCRVCGIRLLTKKGNYWSQRRQCKQHTYFGGEHNWASTRDCYIYDFRKRHMVEIKCRAMDEHYPHQSVCYCEECNRLLS